MRFVLSLLFVVASSSFAAETRPNIVFILADDLGWAELGCYGNEFNETPHIDRLAREGLRHTQAYAAAPVCSPYRAALITGKYPVRVGILDYLRPNSNAGLAAKHGSVATELKKAGYVTGMIGKWHLSGYRYHGSTHEVRPTDRGFDWEVAAEVKSVGNGANFWPYVFRTQPVRWVDVKENELGPKEYLMDRMALEAVNFIRKNKDRPFFLYLSHYATHTILHGKESVVEKYRSKHAPGKSTRDKCYICQDAGKKGDAGNHWAGSHNPHLAAMLESIDDGVGRILKTLESLGLDRRTLIVFTSDNGGETNVTSNAPLRGGKSQLYEGGIRIPLVARWLGQIPAGSVSQAPTVNVDFLPTFLELAKVEAPKGLDGKSLLAHWRDPATKFERGPMFWHYPLDRPHFLGGRSGGAIRDGSWKLIESFETGKVELYDLSKDVGETKDLARERPETAARLRAALATWRESVGAKASIPKRR